MTEEIEFREIPGWPGYRISNTGIVESCRSKSGRITNSWHNIAYAYQKCGYPRVPLCNGGGVWRTNVHVLVLMTFVGPKPTGCMGLHKDGNPRNNNVDNLYWGTHKDNTDDRARHGRTSIGTKVINAVTNPTDVIFIRNMRKIGWTLDSISVATGVSRTEVCRILKGEMWNYVKEFEDEEMSEEEEFDELVEFAEGLKEQQAK
jgi:hypothetical protein